MFKKIITIAGVFSLNMLSYNIYASDQDGQANSNNSADLGSGNVGIVIKDPSKIPPKIRIQQASPYSGITSDNSIPNPKQAQYNSAPIQGPSSAPYGLPNQQAQMQQPVQNNQGAGGASNHKDQVETTMTVINTPNDKIREINREIYDKGRVINELPVTPPKSVNGVLTASMAPGAVPPVIRLTRNRTSAIIFTDMTGQPWPIINYDGLSTEDFVVKRLDNPAPDGYVLSVTPRGAFVNGNLVVVLKGLPSPLSVDFVSGQKEFDSRTEIRVQAKGPNASYSSIAVPDGIDTALLSVLQGVPPVGAKELKVSSNAVQAWLAKDGKMYVRTRYKVMSPAFENVTTSPDGTFAYKMVAVPVVLYKTSGDRFGEFSVDGY
jgi:intracellular multiplication protein IcmK